MRPADLISVTGLQSRLKPLQMLAQAKMSDWQVMRAGGRARRRQRIAPVVVGVEGLLLACQKMAQASLGLTSHLPTGLNVHC